MPRLFNLVTGTILDCEFINYEIEDTDVKIDLDLIVDLFQQIDERATRDTFTSVKGMTSSLMPSIHFNVVMFPEAVDGDKGPLPVIKQMVARIHHLVNQIGLHRIHSYFWYLTQEYPSFQVISVSQDPDDHDVPVIYKIKLTSCQITFCIRNKNVHKPKRYGTMIP